MLSRRQKANETKKREPLSIICYQEGAAVELEASYASEVQSWQVWEDGNEKWEGPLQGEEQRVKTRRMRRQPSEQLEEQHSRWNSKDREVERIWRSLENQERAGMAGSRAGDKSIVPCDSWPVKRANGQEWEKGGGGWCGIVCRACISLLGLP